MQYSVHKVTLGTYIHHSYSAEKLLYTHEHETQFRRVLKPSIHVCYTITTTVYVQNVRTKCMYVQYASKKGVRN